jgi:lambda family phage portal protein
MLSGFEDAAITNARVAASKMGFFKDNDAENDDDDEPLSFDAEPGVFEDIGNREFQAVDFQFPDAAIEPFIRSLLRSSASSLSVSYHNLSSDLTSVNFSSIRQGAIDEREVWKGIQESFIAAVVVPIFERWLEAALLNQKIVIQTQSGPKPLRFDRIEKYKAAWFTGRRWAWIDPAAEQTANERAVAQGFKSRKQVIRETSNVDPEEVWEEIESENEELAERGITPPLPSGSTQPATAEPPKKENAE